MNKSRAISEAIASASSSPSVSTSSAGQSQATSSSVPNSTVGNSSSGSESKTEIQSVGGDQKSDSALNEIVKENKDVTAR